MQGRPCYPAPEGASLQEDYFEHVIRNVDLFLRLLAAWRLCEKFPIAMDRMVEARNEIERGLFLEVLHSFGEAKLAVTGTSMLPSVCPGDVLEVHRESPAEVLPGQLVLFEREGRFFAHRVVGKVRDEDRTLLVTRGDRLRQPDPPVEPRELLGRVTAVRRGRRRVATRLTVGRRIASWLLGRSDLATRVVLRLARL